MYQSLRLWSIRLKMKLEQSNVHQCGMQVNKPICEYMGKVASGLVGGEATRKPRQGKVTIEAGIEHIFHTYFTHYMFECYIFLT